MLFDIDPANAGLIFSPNECLIFSRVHVPGKVTNKLDSKFTI